MLAMLLVHRTTPAPWAHVPTSLLIFLHKTLLTLWHILDTHHLSPFSIFPLVYSPRKRYKLCLYSFTGIYMIFQESKRRISTNPISYLTWTSQASTLSRTEAMWMGEELNVSWIVLNLPTYERELSIYPLLIVWKKKGTFPPPCFRSLGNLLAARQWAHRSAAYGHPWRLVSPNRPRPVKGTCKKSGGRSPTIICLLQ